MLQEGVGREGGLGAKFQNFQQFQNQISAQLRRRFRGTAQRNKGYIYILMYISPNPGGKSVVTKVNIFVSAGHFFVHPVFGHAHLWVIQITTLIKRYIHSWKVTFDI